MVKLSVAIPAHEMQGNAPKFLEHSLRIIQNQTLRDFEVVISDNSEDHDLKKVCNKFPTLNIRYFRNPRRGMAPNTNFAIEHSKGEFIKILYLDDYLYGTTALQDIVDAFESKKNSGRSWLVSGCVHTYTGESFFSPHYPNYHNKIYNGSNTIGSPSVLTIRNDGHLLFEDKLTWILDCELYRRYHDTYGLPILLNKIGVVIRQGDHQITNILPDDAKRAEVEYVTRKYE